VTLTSGQSTNYIYTFTQDTTPGFLTVTLSPPDAVTGGAKWHVNGGAAQGYGASLSLLPGSYSVTFDPVPGWAKPSDQTVQVQRAQTTVVPGNYTPAAGQPVIGGISPPLGPMSGGSLLTIRGANFISPATVSIGGQMASAVTVSSPSEITCVTPSTTVYGSAPVVVNTSGTSTTNLNGFAYGMTLGSKLDLIGSLGGSAFGVTVQDHYAYVGEGRSLVVLDISTPSSPSVIGRVVLPGVVMDIAIFGKYAYVANLEGGLQVVDISNPAAPAIRGFYPMTSKASAEGISILDGLAYVADDNAGLEVFDLGNPVVRTLLSSISCGGGVAVKVKGSTKGTFAYVSTGGSLCVVDVSQPASPKLLGQTPVGDGGAWASIDVSGTSVFATTLFGALHLIDVSQPSAPKDSVLQTGDNGGYSEVAVSGNYLYAQSDIGFTVFNVSGTSLTKVARNASVSSSGRLYTKMGIFGNRAFIADGAAGLQIVDVSNPGNPLSLATFTDSGAYGNYGSVALSGNSLCAALGDFTVFDVSRPGQPTLLARLNGLGASGVVAGNGVAYFKANNNVIDVVSISTPASPKILTSIPYSVVHAYSIILAGNTLYAVGNNTLNQPRFTAVDVSNPLSPQVIGTVDFASLGQGLARSVGVAGNKAVIGINPNSGQPRITVLDISNLSAPVEGGSLTNVGLAMDVRVSSGANYAYVIGGENPSLLHIVDISSLSNPFLAANVPLDSSMAACLAVKGDELYVATTKALYAFDISSPASPRLVRSYSISYTPISRAICLPTDSPSQVGNLYLADSDGGVVALKEEDIVPPSVFINNPTSLPVYTNPSPTLNLGGGAGDNVGVTRITWLNDRGGGGDVSAPFDNWFEGAIRLSPGTNVITVTAFDAAANSRSASLAVVYQPPKQAQTITFSPTGDRTFGDAPFPLLAAASSGLPVKFTVVAGPASIANNILTLTGAGAVTVQADQSGNASFSPAAPQDVSFNVARADQSITFAPLPDRLVIDGSFPLTASASSGLPVFFTIVSGPAVLADNVVALVGGGTVRIDAWQPGNTNYNAALTVQQSFQVLKTPQTITFGQLSGQRFGDAPDAPFFLNATASSGLPVSFSLVSGPATLSGNIVTLTGSGTVVLKASQPGNDFFAAAPDVPQSFSVSSSEITLAKPQWLPDGRFQVNVYGVLGNNYVLQFSPNLIDWTSLFTFTCTDSPTTVADPGAHLSGYLFYRVQAQ
jgi:hypothetical protein